MESNLVTLQIQLFQVSHECTRPTIKEWKIQYQYWFSPHVVSSCFNLRGLQGLSVPGGILDLKGLW